MHRGTPRLCLVKTYGQNFGTVYFTSFTYRATTQIEAVPAYVIVKYRSQPVDV